MIDTRLPPGWTEGPAGILASNQPNGGIIDCAIASGEWFVIFNDDEMSDTLTGFKTRGEAIAAYLDKLNPETR